MYIYVLIYIADLCEAQHHSRCACCRFQNEGLVIYLYYVCTCTRADICLFICMYIYFYIYIRTHIYPNVKFIHHVYIYVCTYINRY